jgi:hypothetical protein
VLSAAVAGCTGRPASEAVSSSSPSNTASSAASAVVPSGTAPRTAASSAPVVSGSPADPASPAAIRWGTAPAPTAGVTLQPDVVIVGGGGTSVRNGTEDGLTYYLDPAAPRASELARGKVMFVTGRVLGRVLDVRRAGEDLAVTIGPVDITEVIRDADFGGTAPVSLEAPVAHPAGNPFWAGDPHPDGSGQAGPGPAGLRRPSRLSLASAPGGPVVPVPLPKPPKLPPLPAVPALPAVPGRAPQLPPSVTGFGKVVGSGALSLVPACCDGGVGAHFTYDKNNVRMVGNVTLTMAKPTVDFALNIKGGTVTKAKLRISGASGLVANFEAARQDSTSQINEKVAIPVDFGVSFVAFGIPLSAVVNQWLVIKTAFSAKSGSIKASGEYRFTAGLGFGYEDGKWSASAPTALTVKQSMVDSLNGISLGVTGIVLAYQARFLVGIGAFGFTAGVYFGFTAALGVVRGSDAGVYVPGTGGTQKVVCKGVQLGLSVNYGVGYSIPKPVADLINLFLQVFKSTPIQRAGGIGQSQQVFQKSAVNPDLKVCGGSV